MSVFVVWWLAISLLACGVMVRFTAMRINEARAQNVADAIALAAVSWGVPRAHDIAVAMSSVLVENESLIENETPPQREGEATITVRTPWGISTSTAIAE